MKKKKIIICILMFFLLAQGCGNKGQMKSCMVVRINSDSNLSESKTDYFYYANGNYMYRYFMESGETERKPFLSKNERMRNFTVCGETIYYVSEQNQKLQVKRLEWPRGETGTVFSWEGIRLLYHAGEADRIRGVQIQAYGENLLMDVTGDLGRQVYVAPLDGGNPCDFVDATGLFPGRSESGKPEKIIYGGVVMERQYDWETGRYEITEVLAEESGRSIFITDKKYVKVGGKEVSFWLDDEEGGFWYCVEGEPARQRISCLEGNEYKYSYLLEEKITVEGGKVIGLIHVVKDWRSHWNATYQSELRYDVLFGLEPETGASAVLYRTEDRQTRILGYRDGIIYLFADYKIYGQFLDSGEKRLLYTLPEHPYYQFDWQGDYLLVRRSDTSEFEMVAVLWTGDSMKNRNLQKRRDK